MSDEGIHSQCGELNVSPLPGESVFSKVAAEWVVLNQRSESLMVESQAFGEVIFLG